MTVQKYECPVCGGAQEMRSNEFGNTLTHVRYDWRNNEQLSVGCFTEPLPTPELSYEQIMARIDQMDARLAQLEEREAARTAHERKLRYVGPEEALASGAPEPERQKKL